MSTTSSLRISTGLLALVLASGAAATAADAAPVRPRTPAPAAADCPADGLRAEPAHCAAAGAVVARAPDRGQQLAPVAPGAAFADGLNNSSGFTRDTLTFPPGNMSDPDVLGAEGVTSQFYGYDFTPDGGTLYGVDDTDSVLFTVNLSTGVRTPVGAMTLHGSGHVWTDVAIDPSTGAAYAMSTDGSVVTTYTVNLATGATTEINTVSAGSMVDMAINCDSEAFTTDTGLDQLHTLNLAAGTFTAVGPLNYNIAFAQGMDFDNETGILHAWLYQGSGINQYSSINLTTGAATEFPAGSPFGEFEGAIRSRCDGPRARIVSGPAGKTANTRPTFGFVASDGTVACSLDRGTPAWRGCTTATTFRPANALAEGRWTFRVRSIDGAWSALDTRKFTVVDCAGLKADVKKAKRKLKAAKDKLLEAQQDGQAGPIAQAKKKVEKAQKKLKKAKAALKAEGVC